MSGKVHQYAHYILYAKGHYDLYQVDGTVWGDLKKIQSDYCGMAEEYITKNDIFTCLVHAVEEVVEPIKLYDFLVEILPENACQSWPNRVSHIKDIEYDFVTAIVGKCLSLLRFIRVIDKNGNTLIELGEPNFSILNSKEEDKE